MSSHNIRVSSQCHFYRHCEARSCIWPQPYDSGFYLSMSDLFGICHGALWVLYMLKKHAWMSFWLIWYTQPVEYVNKIIISEGQSLLHYTRESIPQFLHNKPGFHNWHTIYRWCWCMHLSIVWQFYIFMIDHWRQVC